ncbi:MAG: C4-dicarboxylate ABC transporter permease [Rhodobacteraceae bacterium]|nr:C4-dicarboxylate ABC transporter permease [Paracoccaceae bacterium]QEW19614.1 TRAP-type mannitol/chloroaromatic compound transport system, small permease component [Marinibacterium anthonyi]
MLDPIVRVIDRIAEVTGKAGSLVLPLLVLTILINVFLRYVFNIGMIELEELQWHLNAVTVMCCLAWAYQTDDHVRVDVLHGRMSPRKKALVEVLGVIFLFLPFTLLLAHHAWTIFSFSWRLKEGSPMPSGLPARYIIKGVMAAGVSLLVVQGVGVLLKSLARLMKAETA